MNKVINYTKFHQDWGALSRMLFTQLLLVRRTTWIWLFLFSLKCLYCKNYKLPWARFQLARCCTNQMIMAAPAKTHLGLYSERLFSLLLDHLYFELQRFCADTAFPGHAFICQGGSTPTFKLRMAKTDSSVLTSHPSSHPLLNSFHPLPWHLSLPFLESVNSAASSLALPISK